MSKELVDTRYCPNCGKREQMLIFNKIDNESIVIRSVGRCLSCAKLFNYCEIIGKSKVCDLMKELGEINPQLDVIYCDSMIVIGEIK